MDIPIAIATISQAISLAKAVKEMDASLLVAEYKGKMADIISALADAKIALSDAKLRISELETQIVQLKQANSPDSNFVKIEGYSYDRDNDGKPKGKAYCPSCEQKQKIFVKLEQDLAFPGHPWCCGSCGGTFGTNVKWFS